MIVGALIMVKTITRLINSIACCLIIILLCSCFNGRTSDSCFETNKSSFYSINEIMLAQEEGTYYFEMDDSDGDGRIVDICEYIRQNGDISYRYLNISEADICSINNIRDSFYYDFSVIYVTESGIFYGGVGPRMYAFSRNGESPETYVEATDIDFICKAIDDSWYILEMY